MHDLKNPFDLVKATDLSDGQIADYFVDFPGGASLLSRIRPTSPMPMFIFGGKGSGKTHLMRYLSYPLQIRRHGQGDLARAGIAKEGYLGIYFRCGGLNAQRFGGKGQSQEVWQDVFAYYMELWFAQLVLATIIDLYRDSSSIVSAKLAEDVTRLFDISPPQLQATLPALAAHLESLQRRADVAINNCALTQRLDIEIQVTRGRLVFGIPRVLAAHLPEVKDSLFLYLIDEFENLTEPQQRYINTLVRERQEPCSFKVGVRHYGLRTKETLSAEEENREDSEYEALRLDAELRERPEGDQMDFATELVLRRLAQAEYIIQTPESRSIIYEWFETADREPRPLSEATSLKETERPSEATSIQDLRRKLTQGLRSGVAPGVRSNDEIEQIIEDLLLPEEPLIERTSIFLFYRAWARGNNLLSAVKAIHGSAQDYIRGTKNTRHHRLLRHFKADIMAQLLREGRQRQRYLGFDTYVKMSAGLPRCLLTILKQIFTWAVFFGERPFREGKISVRAQTDGVTHASDWFFTEARAPGATGALVRDAMTRLGQLLREVRFSDKPSECSLSTFSADLTTTSPKAIEVLKSAEDWSMLVRIAGGQHDRNDGRVDEKYQVHPMLAPRWDLPISRRGALGLSGDEVTAIFAPSTVEDFDAMLKKRVAAMTAPFFGEPRAEMALLLPGLIDG